ncbi:Permease of the major facilitator superfamily protein [Pseudooceanicola batsensis HTCC2597]|uniref:Permease of the major facilitator superfamily protein n=1 Tax=Pseudooceanicola batsensis (strain ATCC BAA-863 / DSM 15984 / KCTC 12145 / HTCC2597) TaxID=252305 RepID=A3TYZ5_PSEBH|nr:MFS transporter permease [Pseudooceanicola batsensis]EAQ02813.1 Permease of the major facilitator superfamily protein [Pseudooceanicola batsensis HTCC2597]
MTTAGQQDRKIEAGEVFGRIAGAQGEAAPEGAEARNGLRFVASLSMTKVADGLIDPKLVLSWLVTALGAPGFLASALVPIREAGALLPQVLYAGLLRRMSHRRWMWAAGSVGQGVAALGIAASALWLEGMAAGLAICALLAGLALSRAACSVSTKDVLGRTVAKTRRGAVTGLAGSVASAGVVVFALLLMSGMLEARTPVIIAIALAGLLWIAAAGLFTTLEEPAADRDEAAGLPPVRQFLTEDATLRRFILVRGLLVSTALAPPWLVVVAQAGGDAILQQLGALVLASAAASFVSSFVWGRLSDWSSRRVLALSGAIAAAALAVMVALSLLGLAGRAWAAPAVLFGLMLAYHGVRQGRSTYLVDMSPEDRRAGYAAVANLSIGLILLAVGLFGSGLGAVSADWAIAGFALMAAAGGALALTLKEVEHA